MISSFSFMILRFYLGLLHIIKYPVVLLIHKEKWSNERIHDGYRRDGRVYRNSEWRKLEEETCVQGLL